MLSRLGPYVTFLRCQQVVGIDLTFEASEERGPSATCPDLTVRRQSPAGAGCDSGGQDPLASCALGGAWLVLRAPVGF
jgi:hypothetical protein